MTNQTKYPFQDTSLELDSRVKDLVSRLTEDEKIESMLQYQPAVERLGVAAYKHGTEAAHGLAWLGEATSFPQPVGLACTWDTDLLKEIGSVIGDEARVFYKRNPAVNGLTLWAPTVDMERDPRWGRNEEAYGEDPELTGELSTALVKGIQGDHPKYYKAVATLKHFLANNNEVDRGSGSSSIDPRNMREYYLKAFEKPFKEGGAQSMMTAYNSINGTPALLHPYVNEIVKGEWGMDGFVVSDAGDVMGIKNDHKYYDSHTPGTVESVKAGIDSITDDADLSKQALREGLEQGILAWEDINHALFNTFRVRFRLGEFDPEEGNPYASIGEEAMMTDKAKALSLRAAREQVVLLKNENGTLPLDKTKAGKVAVIGTLGGTVYRDWYAGTMPYSVSPLEAIQSKVGSDKVLFQDGNDRITLTSVANGKAVGLAEGEHSPLIAAGEADTFTLTDWGFGSYTLQSERNGKYVTTDEEKVTASANEVYGWFVKEVFHLLPQPDGSVGLTTWNGKTVTAPNDGNDAFAVSEELKSFGSAETFQKDVVVDGVEEAVAAAKEAETAIVFVGNNPLVNGKEEIDRPSLDLAESQQRLVEAVYAANPNTIVVIVGSYPFTSNWVQENIPAVLYTSHAGQELGNALADVLYADYAPAGRLNMTWVQSADQLTDIKDYDIIQSGRTYQYFEGNVLYPFGHGLTYAAFKYSNLELRPVQAGTEDDITVTVDVTNTGTIASDEVVQLYVRAGKSRVKRPLKTLKGFRRLHIEAGATVNVSFKLPVQELAFWDVTQDRYVVESGTYSIMVGKSSSDIQLVADLTVEGETIPARNLSVSTRAENYDAYLSVDLDESKEGGTAIRALGERGWVLYKDADLGSETTELEARVSSEQEGAVVEVRLGSPDGTLAGRTELAQGGAQQWSSVKAELTGASGIQDVYILLSAGVRLSQFQIR
ncbi:glycoside hydrolase family 3 C-terminal domain-containing protein [Paenibacillus sp. ACRSA]|uniref:glycoside hydrolase family 3 C-terminal domain-containing protein n=1 Tax=Paenibacillus sp. ACRSA TaxID=2918211 RepID=UPI001EF737BC|nr:glycoside hydrolase family 3 C-terminal domain-containing protein [Paenibacillus sp. ACRSA]MCG7378430.1 glycoside hydrolase family 3 C-terminal domain-containing protein [Paenibacillus sp. ACRSA]